MTTLIESVGLLLIVGFAYVVWPPSALLVAGVLLVLAANVIEARRRQPTLSEQ